MVNSSQSALDEFGGSFTFVISDVELLFVISSAELLLSFGKSHSITR